MYDCDDGQWIFMEDVFEISGALHGLPAFTCQAVTQRTNALAACTPACRTPLVKPVSRLMFTPWVFGKPDRPMHA